MRLAAAALAASVAACWGAGAALACDYPGPPPGADEATSHTGDILWAGFSDATERYRHGILGDAVEAGGLRVATADKGPCDLSVVLPDHAVFEDLAPRIADLDGDGTNEVVVVETDIDRGAALAVYGLRGDALVKLAATPNIGQTHRWLAPAGIVDLDGDGRMEIAYVDRPHLAKILRVWRWQDGGLTEIAAARGLTNHRIGEDFISGGVRHCDGRPEIILANADWRTVLAVTLEGSGLVGRNLGSFAGAESLRRALACN